MDEYLLHFPEELIFLWCSVFGVGFSCYFSSGWRPVFVVLVVQLFSRILDYVFLSHFKLMYFSEWINVFCINSSSYLAMFLSLFFVVCLAFGLVGRISCSYSMLITRIIIMIYKYQNAGQTSNKLRPNFGRPITNVLYRMCLPVCGVLRVCVVCLCV